VLWQVADLPGRVRDIDTRQEQEHWWVDGADTKSADELWRYGLPTRRLLVRDPLTLAMPTKDGSDRVHRVAISNGELLDFHPGINDAGKRVLQPMNPSNPKQRYPELLLADRHVIGLGGRWLACWVVEQDEANGEALPQRVELVCLETGRLHARWPWTSTRPPRARFFRGVWMVFDDEGRFAALDTANCQQWALSAAGRS